MLPGVSQLLSKIYSWIFNIYCPTNGTAKEKSQVGLNHIVVGGIQAAKESSDSRGFGIVQLL